MAIKKKYVSVCDRSQILVGAFPLFRALFVRQEGIRMKGGFRFSPFIFLVGFCVLGFLLVANLVLVGLIYANTMKAVDTFKQVQKTLDVVDSFRESIKRIQKPTTLALDILTTDVSEAASAISNFTSEVAFSLADQQDETIKIIRNVMSAISFLASKIEQVGRPVGFTSENEAIAEVVELFSGFKIDQAFIDASLMCVSRAEQVSMLNWTGVAEFNAFQIDDFQNSQIQEIALQIRDTCQALASETTK